ncbi:isoleucine--tRNA ligase [Ectobacillus sp. JY-23]|uniref:isoleucine--tRNA ligase n=1 Tax=Ectobacillus sp. JY-23 TaxID=2933872 RepID=UPI001FF5636E|nr:isoleucine--tRNA ligase [Ectobacillus sp. JY-23]UOY92292.1 isoleucine--tRNA ligase [Ectobacillus sp. JY-23]
MKEVHVKEAAAVREERVRKQWDAGNVFARSVENRAGQTPFVFYEGPPTANGLPHVGHALGRTIKDVVARYKTMTGHYVVRKAGWDTHGLPVELGVEKQLGISGKHEIEAYGVEAFIEKCKESVFAYEKQWRSFTEKLGYWVDMDDPYVTMDNSYIESVWHVLGTIHEKGLLYKGHRVSPYCPSCQTSLSSHEVAQGYQDVKDMTATAKFKLKDRNEYFLGWTTTPWTLPANVALAVNPALTYVRAETDGAVYIVAKELASSVFKNDYRVLSEHKGTELCGLAYEPPFPFVTVEKGHVVVAADYVTAQSGTGVVHIAPAYGEDDYKVVQANDLSFVNVVDEKGCYTADVPFLAGRFVKDCDVDIVRYLAEAGLLYHKEKYEHSYPFCWRCDSPLLYYATDSWFIRTTALKENMLENNAGVTWHPEHIKNGRFGNFLENMVDWNISRNRYWGTPLNVWECGSCGHEAAPKSLRELQELTASDVTDLELHKPYVDDVKLVCKSCGAAMKRTPEVIDVWFDSGAMPFAQYHYPFANNDIFSQQFPADVVAEGIDQTRGWFYSLLAVSTLFTGKAPYKRVLSLGHVLDEYGQKMSKSKGNALDPVALIEEFGADALRWALLADSAPWNPKKFSARVVREAKSKMIDTLMNVHSFYALYANLDGYVADTRYTAPKTTLDQWVISRLHSTVRSVRSLLDDYQFTNAARELAVFTEDLSNWYVRRSRQRFWASGMTADKQAAYETLHEALVTLSRMLAPFTPFIADDVHENLTGSSVHVCDYPLHDPAHIQTHLEAEMEAVRQVVELGRSARNASGLKVKQPLNSLTLITDAPVPWDTYSDIICDELNVKQVTLSAGDDDLVTYQCKLNFKQAGSKFGKQANIVHQALQGLQPEQVRTLLAGSLSLSLPSGETVVVEKDDVLLTKVPKAGFSIVGNELYSVVLDTNITEELVAEGMARELVRAVQEHRKKLDLPVNLRVGLTLHGGDEVKQAIKLHEHVLTENLLLESLHWSESAQGEAVPLGTYTVYFQLHL